jgi:hypothetical protein
MRRVSAWRCPPDSRETFSLESVLEPHAELCHLVRHLARELRRRRDAETPGPFACGERQIVEHGHVARGPRQRILPHAPDIHRALPFGQARHVAAVEKNFSCVQRHGVRYRIEESAFSCSVGADDRYGLAALHFEREVPQDAVLLSAAQIKAHRDVVRAYHRCFLP